MQLDRPYTLAPRREPAHPGRLALRHSQGQALLLGTLVLFIGALLLFYLAASGFTLQRKTELNSAADAAAYSAALVHARAFNFDAYTNRAIAINEVAMGQLTTLIGIADFAASQKRASDSGLFPDYDKLRFLFTPFYGEAGYRADVAAVAQSLGGQRPEMLRIADETDRTVRELLLAAQDELHAQLQDNGPGSLMDALLRQTMAANINTAPQASTRIAANTGSDLKIEILQDTIGGATRRQESSQQERARLAAFVTAMLKSDPLVSEERRWDFDVPLPTCLIPIASDRIVRRGSTALEADGKAWTTTDTISWFRREPQEQLFGIINANCTEPFEIPLGAQTANVSNAQLGSYDPAAQRDTPIAYLQGAVQRTRVPFSGIPAARELLPELRTSDAPPLRIVVKVTRRESNDATVQLPQQTGQTLGNYVAESREPAHAPDLVSLAAAELVFHRPEGRADGRRERPSLFNPFWHAKLSRVPDAVRVQALREQP